MAAAIMGRQLLVFGGRIDASEGGAAGDGVSDELVTFDTHSLALLATDKTGAARCAHTLTALSHNLCVATGGIDMTGPFALRESILFRFDIQDAAVWP
ncbi:hypothetical protein T484DRAFT_1767877 [Baffinella frigidus]|nr:hypothetical protein T484DRAFT_1767877 [Cryptophyta sp. CCMP2293]